MTRDWRLLVFGATGAIGSGIAGHARARGWAVTGVSRRPAPGSTNPDDGVRWVSWDPLAAPLPPALAEGEAFDAVCWAQGRNMADAVGRFDAGSHLDLSRANVVTVIEAMGALLSAGRLRAGGARLVVISSIWQDRARDDKLSYTVSKAAVGGLVRSASVDLGRDGHLVNAVCPGVTDTPMTRANMSAAQVAAVAGRTLHGRLPDLATVADTALFLLSEQNRAISGQSVTVDLGMSHACLL